MADTDNANEDPQRVAQLAVFVASFRTPPSLEEVKRVRLLPQRSQEWLDARALTRNQEGNKVPAGTPGSATRAARTGSSVGGLIGVGYDSVPKALFAAVHGSDFQGNAATRWGTEHEPYAHACMQAYFDSLVGKPHHKHGGRILSAAVVESGLEMSLRDGRDMYSPDGIVTFHVRPDPDAHGHVGPDVVVVELCEYKCPAGAKDHTRFDGYSSVYPMKQMNRLCVGLPPPGQRSAQQQADADTLQLAFPTSEAYFAQVMWGMYVLLGNGVITDAFTYMLTWHDASANSARTRIPFPSSAAAECIPRARYVCGVNVAQGPRRPHDERPCQCAHTFFQTEAHGAAQVFVIPLVQTYLDAMHRALELCETSFIEGELWGVANGSIAQRREKRVSEERAAPKRAVANTSWNLDRASANGTCFESATVLLSSDEAPYALARSRTHAKRVILK